jgi:hypothetical protein
MSGVERVLSLEHISNMNAQMSLGYTHGGDEFLRVQVMHQGELSRYHQSATPQWSDVKIFELEHRNIKVAIFDSWGLSYAQRDEPVAHVA